MNNNRGFAPILIIIAVVLVGGATYAIVPRTVLKSFFEKGDIPAESQKTRGELKEEFKDGDIPNQDDFADTIDSGLNLQDDRKMLGLKEYNPTKEYQVGDTAVSNQTQIEPPFDNAQGKPFDNAQDKSSGAAQGKPFDNAQGKPVSQGCVSNPAPVFTHHITDVSQLKYVVAPPTMGAGPSLKPHGYIGTSGTKMPLYAPAAMTIKDGAYYEGGPYMFDFSVSCEVTVRFGHITDPVDALKALLPAEPAPANDSRTKELSGVSFKAGELIGYTVGTSQGANWDFGVYNSSVTNRYANDPDWNMSATYTTAVCPFEYFPSDLKIAYTSQFDSKILSGNPPHGESFCK